MTRRALPAAAALLAAVASAIGAPVASAAGSIAGHVAGAVAPVCVDVLDARGQSVVRGPTSEAGDYALGGVPAGTWWIEFLPDGGCFDQLAGQAFQFYPGVASRESGTPVTVAEGKVTGAIDATMQAEARITGTVTDEAGLPLPRVCAILIGPGGEAIYRQPSDADGVYRLRGLPAGTFTVSFVADGCGGSSEGYANRSYPQAITLRPGDLRSDVDVRLARAVGGGTAAPVRPAAASGAAAAGSAAGGSGAGEAASGIAGSSILPRRARLVLRAAPAGGYRLDRRRRLRLRVTCTRDGARCRGRLVLRSAGAVVGRATFTLEPDGRVHTVTVRLRRSARNAVGVSAYLAGRRLPEFRTTLRLHRAGRLRQPT